MKKIFGKPILKQYLTVVACLLSLTLLLSVWGYGYIYQMMTKSATSYAQETAHSFDAEIQYIVRRADSIFVNLLFDPEIEQFLLTPYSSRTPQYINALQMQFLSYSFMNADITDIALSSPTMNWSNYFDAATLQNFREQMENTYGVKCLGLQASPLTTLKKSNEVRLVFARNMYGMHANSSYGKLLGTIFLSLDLNKSPITLPSNDSLGTYFILVSSDSSFSFNCPQALCTEILSQWDKKILQSGYSEQDIPGYRIYASQVDGTDLYILSVLNREILTKDVNQTMTIFMIVVILVLLVLALLMLVLRQSVVTPIQSLNAHILQLKDQPPIEQKPAMKIAGCEEIQNLNSSFQELLDRQTQLSQELHDTTVTLYESELGRKQAELDFLRSQINPHFLYNALESINSLASEHGIDEISDAVAALGKLFRYNVKGAGMVPLRQELDTIRAYLTVQQLRFAEKLNVITSVRENTLDLPIMKLLVQPLVENAVHHGIEPKSGRGTLYIGARQKADKLLISVYDDGVGIPVHELKALQSQLKDPPSSTNGVNEHIGLMKVACRIRLQYGEEYGLWIESDPGSGTRQILTLPVTPKEETEC